MSSRYQYQPLKSRRLIRAFTVLPSRDSNAPVQGVLSEVSLDSNPSFEALSYVWGSPESGHEVTILTQSTNGTKGTSHLQVTPNCLSALQALRFRLRARKLWIDAICIDQASIAEKGQQVPLIAEIYGGAKRVLVWLNPGDQEKKRVRQTARLFRLVGRLYQMRLLRLYEKDEQSDSRSPQNTKLVGLCDRYVDSKSQELGDSFNAPFLNQYFQRVWTVQEIAMAHSIRIHYGAKIVSWRDFVASALFAVKRGGFARNQEADIDVFRDSEIHWNLLNCLESHFVLPDIYGVESLYNRGDGRNILSKYTPGTAELALIKSKGLKATEPKDMAYAMLWAFPNSSEATDPLRRADYDKPIEVIFTEYTTAIFVKTKGSSVQFYWVNSTPRNASLPSWVPDWKESTSMSLFVWGQGLREFRAAKEDSLKYEIEIEGRLLRISGIEYSGMKALIRLHKEVRQRNLHEANPGELLEALIDTTELVKGFIETSRIVNSTHDEGLLEAVHRVVHSQKHMHDPGPEDQSEFFAKPKEVELSERLSISVGLLRIRVFDKLSFLTEETTISVDPIETSLEQFLLEKETEEVVRGAQALPNLPPFFAVIVSLSPYIDVYHFLHIALLDHRDKDFFITDKGNLGVAFQGLDSGDVVGICKGCPSPMIVRKSEMGGRHMYRLHGPAYVDGIMMGEAWVEGGDDLQVFELA